MERKRVHPTLNSYQEKIVVAMAFNDGIEPASIVKCSIGDKIKNLSDNEREYYLKLYERMTPEERKNPTK
jgi:hypothetical protein